MDSGENLQPLGSPLHLAQKSQPWPHMGSLGVGSGNVEGALAVLGNSPSSRECIGFPCNEVGSPEETPGGCWAAEFLWRVSKCPP